MFSDPKEIREYRADRRQRWLKESSVLISEAVDGLKKLVSEAKAERDGIDGFNIANGCGGVFGEDRLYTKREFQILRQLNYDEEIYLYFGAKLAKAEFDDYTREQTGVAQRRASAVWKRFLSGVLPAELKILLGSQKAVEAMAGVAEERATAQTNTLYVCTRCGRVMANPIPGDRTCRGTQPHAWTIRNPSPP